MRLLSNNSNDVWCIAELFFEPGLHTVGDMTAIMSENGSSFSEVFFSLAQYVLTAAMEIWVRQSAHHSCLWFTEWFLLPVSRTAAVCESPESQHISVCTISLEVSYKINTALKEINSIWLKMTIQEEWIFGGFTPSALKAPNSADKSHPCCDKADL